MNPIPPHSRPSPRRRRRVAAAIVIVGVVAAGTIGCSGSVVHNYRTFQSALDRGASCAELYDQRARFENEETLAKIDRDLQDIGCTSPGATRNDD